MLSDCLILALISLSRFYGKVALSTRHERRSLSPEDATIFDNLENLDLTFEVRPDSYHGFGAVHQGSPTISSSAGSYSRLLAPEITCSNELNMPDFDVESSSSNQLSRSEAFWHFILSDDPWTIATTPITVEKNVSGGSQHSKSSALPSGVSNVNAFRPSEITPLTGSRSTTEVESKSQSEFTLNQDASGPSKEQAGRVRSFRPGPRTLKRKLPNSYKHETVSSQISQSKACPYENEKEYQKEENEFENGLLHPTPEMRLIALRKNIQELWPVAKLTGQESFATLKESILEKLPVPRTDRSPFYLFLDENKREETRTQGLEKSSVRRWNIFIKNYRKLFRPEQLKWVRISRRSRAKITHHLCIAAASRRLNILGIYEEIELFFSSRKPMLYEQSKQAGTRPNNMRDQVTHFSYRAKEASVCMLYQIELLYRFSKPPSHPDDLMYRDELFKIWKDLKHLWITFKPFGKNNQSKTHVSDIGSFYSTELMKGLYQCFKSKTKGDYPKSFKASRLLISQWCFKKDRMHFELLEPRRNRVFTAVFFMFLSDCTLHDLVAMIA